MTTLEWPSARRKALCKHAAYYRHKVDHGMGMDTLRLELSRIVIDTTTDKDGNKVDVYLMPHETAAVISYCYCRHPSAHDMHRA